MSGEICTDNRFEIIAAYKNKLIESTNIETSPDEMAVIDSVLFRFWQMRWLNPHKTNADRIRAMSDEELADWLEKHCWQYGWLDWLKQEVEDGND